MKKRGIYIFFAVIPGKWELQQQFFFLCIFFLVGHCLDWKIATGHRDFKIEATHTKHDSTATSWIFFSERGENQIKDICRTVRAHFSSHPSSIPIFGYTNSSLYSTTLQLFFLLLFLS